MLLIPEIVIDLTDKEMLLIIEIVLEGEKRNSSLINIYFYLLAKMFSFSCLFYGVHHTMVLWGHSTCLAGGYVVYWSQVVFIITSWCYTTTHVPTLLMLFACACVDGTTAWHHWENTIKGGSSFLFIIGNADSELNTSVILPTSGNILFS